MAWQSASLRLVMLWYERNLPPLLGGWRDVSTLPALLTPSALLLVLLFVPLLSLLSLLLLLDAEGTRVHEMTRAFAVVANYASAVVFCRGHGSPDPQTFCRRARTDKVGRIDRGHYAANVGDPEVGLLEVECADALVLRQKGLENEGRTHLGVHGEYRAHTGILRGLGPDSIARTSFLTCSALSASLEQPSNFSQKAAHARCPCPEPSSIILPTKRWTTKHAAPFVVKNSTLYKFSLTVFQASSLEPSVSVAADSTGAPCRTWKAALS